MENGLYYITILWYTSHSFGMPTMYIILLKRNKFLAKNLNFKIFKRKS